MNQIWVNMRYAKVFYPGFTLPKLALNRAKFEQDDEMQNKQQYYQYLQESFHAHQI